MKNAKILLLFCLLAVFSYGCAGKIGIKKEVIIYELTPKVFIDNFGG